MKLIILTTASLLAAVCTPHAQSRLPVAANIRLPKDSVRQEKVLAALSAFLTTLDERNNDHPMIDNHDKAQTLDLLDEFRGVRKSSQHHSDSFYSPCLTNIVARNDSTWFLQLAYCGIDKGSVLTRAVFNLVAHIPAGGPVTFSSPISDNTKHWQQTRIGHINFHHKSRLNTAKAKALVRYIDQYDTKLGNTVGNTEYYCCDNGIEVLYILGISYESDHTGRRHLTLSSAYGSTSVVVSSEGGDGYSAFDPHDLWHARLRKVMKSEQINRPVDEGCAYLYGGSWGLSWKDIYRQFLETYGKDTSANWLELYGKFQNFGKSESEPLNVPYVINALIINKLEKEKGFAAVKELLACGKYEKSNDNYFAALNRLLGINRENFNAEVWKLIKNYH